MDYIVKQIDKRLKFYESANSAHEVANYLRVKIEYGLIFILSYLWNTNIHKLAIDEREHVVEKIFQPTIGSIVEIGRTLDIEKLVFRKGGLSKAINEYPKIRNERLGHGYAFEDTVNVYSEELRRLSTILYDSANSILARPFDIIIVTQCVQDVYTGINFKSSGTEYVHWRCPKVCEDLLVDHIYTLDDKGTYAQMSPFIEVTPQEEFFIYRNVKDRLLGRIEYNQLLKTGNKNRDWKEFDLDIENDGFRRRTANGTIINVFTINFKQYIDIGIKREIKSFLLKNKSSVCATIWGHGGVGKTAAVQSLCEDLGVTVHGQ